MNIEISVPVVVELIKGLQGNPYRIFEMIGMNVRKDVGYYLTKLMKAELTQLGMRALRVKRITVMAVIPGTFA